MKIFYNLFSLFIFISSSMYAQNSKDSSPAKSAEQKEIKATNHLKKELEQEQLTAPPERIADTTASFKRTDKRKHKKCKPRTMNDSNKQSE